MLCPHPKLGPNACAVVSLGSCQPAAQPSGLQGHIARFNGTGQLPTSLAQPLTAPAPPVRQRTKGIQGHPKATRCHLAPPGLPSSASHCTSITCVAVTQGMQGQIAGVDGTWQLPTSPAQPFSAPALPLSGRERGKRVVLHTRQNARSSLSRRSSTKLARSNPGLIPGGLPARILAAR